MIFLQRPFFLTERNFSPSFYLRREMRWICPRERREGRWACRDGRPGRMPRYSAVIEPDDIAKTLCIMFEVAESEPLTVVLSHVSVPPLFENFSSHWKPL